MVDEVVRTGRNNIDLRVAKILRYAARGTRLESISTTSVLYTQHFYS